MSAGTEATLPVLLAQSNPGAVISTCGLVRTLSVPLRLPHDVVTVTPRKTIGVAPAVYVIVGVPCPPVIVPSVMVQAYVAGS